jgi:prolyl-tRNA synthetase
MLEKARAFRDSHIVIADNMDNLEAAVNDGKFVKAMWCGSPECEKAVKERTSASSRVMPFDQTPVSETCVCCGKKADKVIYFAKAY